jgi:two-component system, OmpR family, response regulator ChvI
MFFRRPPTGSRDRSSRLFLFVDDERTNLSFRLEIGRLSAGKERGIALRIDKESTLAALRGQEGTSAEDSVSTKVVVGDLALDLESNRARWRGREVDLTLNQFKMVYVLASRAGTDVRFRDIYDSFRKPGFLAGVGATGYHANVRTAIKRIRIAFRAVDESFAHIEPCHGIGYRWRSLAAPSETV